MNNFKIFEPAICCETGVCGVDADTVLITFTADIDWLKKQGVTVQRFNLAQEPAAFIKDPLVKSEITKHGESSLPLLMVDNTVVSRGIYPDRKTLAELAGLESLVLSSDISTSGDQTGCGCGSSSC